APARRAGVPGGWRRADTLRAVLRGAVEDYPQLVRRSAAVLLAGTGYEPGRMRFLDEFTQVLDSSHAVYGHGERLSDGQEASVEHARSGKLLAGRNEPVFLPGHRIDFARIKQLGSG